MLHLDSEVSYPFFDFIASCSISEVCGVKRNIVGSVFRLKGYDKLDKFLDTKDSLR